ncbi:uncharacterized protein si:ch73-95l15.5 isoform X1 [Poecilia formosa]|uniref:uncharacterized protein si:ch73-95l15.5 isoform X1 n=1 Tax=Poecilia formosa TaxID=48698 RepID=UPI00044384B0|nr:PREDICTED: uncharacterized protein LOC103154663 isoform X1 [Poecilia formosa]XP_016518389.1 PREDICTED: uncharacterized protein LOC103154663 isoform X1 [Poecilia formosa]
MSSTRKNELCRICGGSLQGNQRRWLFAAQNRRNNPPGTPTGSVRGGSLTRSTQSSPWGSTLSLGSSGSLSRSQVSLSSPSKSVDILTVLTHILGQSVPRNGRTGEFVCGKCVSALERVFKFDTVIARVRVLSSERLQKLTQERDKIRQWVRQNYRQRHPQELRSRSSASEEDSEAEREGYRDMLKNNMALSEYECWSERWDTCPYFIRTGKRCRKGKGCEGCDSLRVSDSDYESVCGIPRHMPSSPLELTRDKSRSMPLHWHGVPRSSPPSLTGSSLSLRAPSRTESLHSLDTLDGNDPFCSLGDQAVSFVLTELRSIEGKPLGSPSGSKIPVLGRKGGKNPGPASPRVSRVLIFGDLENGGGQMEEEDGDVLTELRDEYMPLQRENSTGRLQSAVRHLRAQLDQAGTRIRTLEAELRRAGPDQVNGSEDLGSLTPEEGGGASVLQSLGHALHSRERLIQECLVLIRGLCVESGTGAELGTRLTGKLLETLKELLSDNKVALETLRSEAAEAERSLAAEVEALRRAGRDREADLDTLRTVLQSSQDVVNELRASLEDRERRLGEAETQQELWRRRDAATASVLKDKDALILNLQQRLDHPQSTGSEEQAAARLKTAEENSATLCEEVTKLSAAVQASQELLQAQQQSHAQTVSSLTARLRDAQQQLSQAEEQQKKTDRERRTSREDGERRERLLRESLQKRDRLIEQILVDAEERERLLQDLQQNLQNKREPVTAVKHTL